MSEVPDSEQQHDAATGCPESIAEMVTALTVQQQTDGPKSIDPMSNVERAVRHMTDCSPKEFMCLNPTLVTIGSARERGKASFLQGDRQRKNYPLQNGDWLQVFLVPVPLLQHPVFPFLPFAQ